jgi:hypothetical protein
MNKGSGWEAAPDHRLQENGSEGAAADLPGVHGAESGTDGQLETLQNCIILTDIEHPQK